MLYDTIVVMTVQQEAVAFEVVAMNCHFKSRQPMCCLIKSNLILLHQRTPKKKICLFSNARAN